MTNYDYPSEDELQPNSTYNYDLIPTEQDGNINYTPGVYDQFIGLRDTLVYSQKKYNGKGGWKLCVGEKEETVEVLEPQLCKIAFEPAEGGNPGVGTATVQAKGNYAEHVPTGTQYGLLTVKINKSGWYRIEHKEEILLRPDVDKKVHCYVVHFPMNPDGTYPPESDTAHAIHRAVFDWQGEFEKTFSGTTSGTEPSGTCSVKVKFVLGDIIQKMTAYGVIECQLNKGDYLTLRCYNSDTQPDWLVMQPYSNWFQVQYIDLPLPNNN